MRLYRKWRGARYRNQQREKQPPPFWQAAVKYVFSNHNRKAYVKSMFSMCLCGAVINRYNPGYDL